MTVVALQGLHGGVGTTSITAGLAWALCSLGEKVLVVDLCPDNMLRLHFNTPFEKPGGWAYAHQTNAAWQDSAMRYLPGLEFLPFGQLSFMQLRQHIESKSLIPDYLTDYLTKIKTRSHYQWVLLDLPFTYTCTIEHLLPLIDLNIQIVTPNANSHVRLHQQELIKNSHFLVNQLSIISPLQQDLYLLWQHTVDRLLPFVIHHDEAVCEAFAVKCPVGEYSPASMANSELITFANWCLLQTGGRST